jgi:hypothetical protein
MKLTFVFQGFVQSKLYICVYTDENEQEERLVSHHIGISGRKFHR